MLGKSDKQQWKREKKPGNDRTSNHRTETFECTISTCIEKHSNKHRKTSQQLVLCPIFRKMALKDKKAQVLSSNFCHIYLTPGHHAAKCTSKVSCKHCGKSHHSWLCSKSQDQSEKPKPKNNGKTHGKSEEKSSYHKAYALDDSCHR